MARRNPLADGWCQRWSDRAMRTSFQSITAMGLAAPALAQCGENHRLRARLSAFLVLVRRFLWRLSFLYFFSGSVFSEFFLCMEIFFVGI